MKTLNKDKLCSVIEKTLSERDGSEVHVVIKKINNVEDMIKNDNLDY